METVKGLGQKRRYSSARRDEGALQTRRAITSAAAERFVRDGYAATSLAAIATDAQCARPTVFAVYGSKFALMKQVLDEALAGDDEPGPVAERPWFQPVWAARTPEEVCAAYADVCVLIGGRAASVFEAVRRAVDADPDVRVLWDGLLENRRAGAQMVVERVAKLAGRRRGRHLDLAVDQVWFLNDPAHYTAFVDGCGWAEKDFRAWLTRALVTAVSSVTDRPAGDRATGPRPGGH
jgi:AcrR family transcriptional regulator